MNVAKCWECLQGVKRRAVDDETVAVAHTELVNTLGVLVNPLQESCPCRRRVLVAFLAVKAVAGLVLVLILSQSPLAGIASQLLSDG